MLRKSVRAAVLLASVAATGSAFAADSFTERFEGKKPAVSGINGKIEFGYLYTDIEIAPGFSVDGDAFFGQGAVSVPVGHSFGIQIDAGGFTGDLATVDISGAGIGGHFFWRDPDVALLGGYVHYVNTDIAGVIDLDNIRYGVEGELYLDRFSIEGFVGADYLDVSVGPFSVDDTFFAAEGVAAFYPTDNLRIFAGIEHAFDETALIAGGEFLFNTGWQAEPAVFARGAFSGDSTTVMAGLKFYFGESGKSLIRRHREDDPQIGLFNNVGAAGSAGCATPVAPPMVYVREANVQTAELPKVMTACGPGPVRLPPRDTFD